MYNEKAYALGAKRSCIREAYEYGRARAAIVGEENVYDYSLGNPSIPAPPQVNEAIRQILEDTDSLQIHGYMTAAGDMQARQAIADDLNDRYGTNIAPADLFMGCGAAAEVSAVLRALSVPGGEVLVVAPYFPEYALWVEQTGMKLQVVPADVPDFQIRVEAVEQMLSPNTVAVIINSPNNPSGVVYTEDTLRALAALLTEKSRQYGHPIYIVADEPYRELVYDGKVAPFIPTLYPNTIVCYSYSKSLSLPGERIGYVYVPAQAQDAKALYAAVAGAARSCGHVCAPSLMQRVIARCAYLRPDLDAYDKNRKALYEGLVAAGYQVAKPDGAFYLFVKAPGGDATVFAEKAKQKDLLLVPGDSFGCPDYFRVCYCVNYDMIVRSLPVFRALIEEN